MPGSGDGIGMVLKSLHEIIEMAMSLVHLRPLYGAEDEIWRILRTVRALCCSPEPVILVRRHQHELTPAVLGDLDRFPERAVLDFAELALEFQ
jgi:hypothetical protein